MAAKEVINLKKGLLYMKRIFLSNQIWHICLSFYRKKIHQSMYVTVQETRIQKPEAANITFLEIIIDYNQFWSQNGELLSVGCILCKKKQLYAQEIGIGKHLTTILQKFQEKIHTNLISSINSNDDDATIADIFWLYWTTFSEITLQSTRFSHSYQLYSIITC